MKFVVRITFLVFLFIKCVCVSHGQSGEDIIKLWYGDEQTFGRSGVVQRYVNLLGNVDPSKNIIKLDYALNEGPFHKLSIGPDLRRLQRPGDFNVEIEVEALKIGLNSVVIEAVGDDGSIFTKSVSLNWEPVKSDPDKTIRWGEVNSLMEVAQPIDGLWIIEGDKVLSDPNAYGYDRVLGVGDMDWKEYEVLFPMEIRGMDPGAYDTEESSGPALLLILRWMGHSDSPVYCEQPHCGWEPYGGTASLSWPKDEEPIWSLSTRWNGSDEQFSGPELTLGAEYWVRFRVESKAGANFYSFKIWDGGLDAEPDQWTRRKLSESVNFSSGSFIFVAHHIDLAIGTMQITPIGNLRYQIVDLVTQNTEVFVQLPYFALWILGILWGLAYRRKDVKRGNWIITAFVILLVTGLFGALLANKLPDYLFSNGWITRRVTYVYVFIKFIPIGGHFIAGIILFKTLWPTKVTS